MTSSRETLLLRGASAADAVPYQRAQGAPTWGRRSGPRGATDGAAPQAPTAEPVPAPRDEVPPVTAPRAPVPPVRVAPVPVPDAAARADAASTTRVGLRLGEVYAEQLAKLREEARRAGWAAGHAEGLVAAEAVVRAAEQAAEERLAAVQARWERRLASATAAMGAAVERLDATAVPVVDQLREDVLDMVVLLVGDLLGREVALADSAGMDAVRRALVLCPTDVPVRVRLHPDDLAEVPAEALASLPGSVTVVGDETVERAGALAEAGTQRVDAQLSAAFQRVREVLRP
ncbi:FliH/SctL family protein [Modestobacter sp. VKM Ac-2986]|uniref:FliH/SctL family protein n=1 Tax=Modestobacter sp. VKM Ac-2986 TaxID=3004140 RepID=UPI0022AB9718|nr:FliH/SctL family protein [Modestobacter sp. VKM Ac-2986]MCZ2830284.1 FliH/SctL family protein [Modestobacter sp. VKM Ac-2986]